MNTAHRTPTLLYIFMQVEQRRGRITLRIDPRDLANSFDVVAHGSGERFEELAIDEISIGLDGSRSRASPQAAARCRVQAASV